MCSNVPWLKCSSYFPYSRQSKKKSHRGAITARMLANLLSKAGVSHVITVDLHVSVFDFFCRHCSLKSQAAPMQGFFGKPVDNLHAEPMIARWIRSNVPDWHEAVVVSKNPGGTKRATSLADALKLNFGMVTTDRRRTANHDSQSLEASMLFASFGDSLNLNEDIHRKDSTTDLYSQPVGPDGPSQRLENQPRGLENGSSPTSAPNETSHRQPIRNSGPSPLTQSVSAEETGSQPPSSPSGVPHRRSTVPLTDSPPSQVLDPDELAEEYTDERAREVVTSRLIQGHVVDDDYPSPSISTRSGSASTIPVEGIGPPHFDERDPMASSIISTVSSRPTDHALGGSYDAGSTSDEEEEILKNPELEHTITLVGNVKDSTVFIIDDMIDGSHSWIAAAETVVKRGNAKKVYAIATHGLFGDESLADLEACDCIDHIVVTNTFPIAEKAKISKKLIVLDLSSLLAEAIRRNHFGESISALYQHC